MSSIHFKTMLYYNYFYMAMQEKILTIPCRLGEILFCPCPLFVCRRKSCGNLLPLFAQFCKELVVGHILLAEKLTLKLRVLFLQLRNFIFQFFKKSRPAPFLGLTLLVILLYSSSFASFKSLSSLSSAEICCTLLVISDCNPI